MSRRTDLLALAATALAEGSDPFSLEFLSANDVTADECFELGESLAQAARVYVRLLEHRDWLVTLTVEAAMAAENADPKDVRAAGLRAEHVMAARRMLG